MKSLDIKEATAPLADYARNARDESVIVTVDGRPVAAVVSLEGSDWEALALSSSAEFRALIERSRKRHREEGGVSSAEMRRRVGL